jgi:MFS family permease
MAVCAALTFIGALVSLTFLPETSEPQQDTVASRVDSRPLFVALSPAERTEFASAAGLFAANRLALAGVLQSALGLFLLEQAGDRVQVAGYSLGVATLTGLGLGSSTLIATTSAPIIGRVADRASNRWRVAAGGLAPDTVGLGLLAAGLPLTTLIGLPLAAITDASNQDLATAIVGGLGNRDRRSRRLGILFTVGDSASAVGPPLACGLMPVLGIRNIYWLDAGLFAFMALAALRRAATSVSRPARI